MWDTCKYYNAIHKGLEYQKTSLSIGVWNHLGTYPEFILSFILFQGFFTIILLGENYKLEVRTESI